MPNGHGGVPFLGTPILFAAMFATFVALPLRSRFGWAWVGWRLAYSLHMWNADEYGGAYTEPGAYRRAVRRYRVLAVVYTVITVAIGFSILCWRGLP